MILNAQILKNRRTKMWLAIITVIEKLWLPAKIAVKEDALNLLSLVGWIEFEYKIMCNVLVDRKETRSR